MKERIICYTVRIPVSLDREIESQIKEKGFRSKSDFLKNAVEIYIQKDMSATSDRALIPKSRVTSQYTSLMEALEKKSEEVQRIGKQTQLLAALTFVLLFRQTRLNRFRSSEDQMNGLLKYLMNMADGSEGITARSTQKMIHEIIASDLPLKNERSTG